MNRVMRRWSGQRAGWAVAVLMASCGLGCATRVTTSTSPPTQETANLPRPSRVVVTPFLISPGAVTQDQAIGLRLERELSGEDQSGERAATAAEVQSAISDTVVNALNKAGLPAELASPYGSHRPGDLLVTGRILRIDEGNRARRLGIGFGAGKSIVQADAQVYAVVAGQPPMLLQSYDGSADSGRKPGLAAGASMAVSEASPVMGAVSALTNVSGEVRRSPVGKEAASFGQRLARDIGELAAAHGWIAESSVPDWTR